MPLLTLAYLTEITVGILNILVLEPQRKIMHIKQNIKYTVKFNTFIDTWDALNLFVSIAGLKTSFLVLNTSFIY